MAAFSFEKWWPQLFHWLALDCNREVKRTNNDLQNTTQETKEIAT